ncbi:MAG: DNA methyltransferase, partial [Gallionella sp.]
MTSELFPQTWLINTLLDDGFIAQQSQQLPTAPDLQAWLAQNFDAKNLAARSEAQLEDKFIGPLLAQLGWTKVTQTTLTVQGKLAKPDWCLLLEAEQENALIASKDHTLITAICESKAWDKTLDTGKADRMQNPHHQLQDYLSTLRVRFGFLTNGRIWRVYDTDKITAKKTYIEFDLERLLQLEEGDEKSRGLALFAFFFGRDTYAPTAQKSSAIQQAIAASNDFTLAVEENLKAVIYGFAGEDSLFEIMGRAIHHANPNAPLEQVYENSVVLLFRLLFVVYFEDKNHALLSRHRFYNRYSLAHIFQTLREQNADRDALHDGVFSLKKLFEMLDEGAGDIDIPLFNGGLFDPARAPLLLTSRIFDNATLRSVLEKLLYKTHRGTTLFDTRRDFKNMSVTHLGRIYEGLLEFRFERAAAHSVYLEFESSSTKGKIIEAYFDSYDLAKLRTEKGFKAHREIIVAAGEVTLKSASNSRKTTASYYTPPSLSQPLVKAAIDHATAQGKAFAELKILDNACGSGHFLVEALGYLTDLALARLDSDADLQKLVADEREKIAEQLHILNLDYAPEDAQILKRALLKRCIFGVDLNPFAVELARLSLWMDSFIFGTPLSFIEHHIQHGNALMGASAQDLNDYKINEAKQSDLFVDDLSNRFDELRSVMHELDAMQDTTAAEVERSKALWKQIIAP